MTMRKRGRRSAAETYWTAVRRAAHVDVGDVILLAGLLFVMAFTLLV